MVLSSNWLDLQKSQQLGAKKHRKNKNREGKKIVKQSGLNKLNTIDKRRKGSKLMDMVHSMSHEIKAAEKNKVDGNKFEFKATITNIENNNQDLELKPVVYTHDYDNRKKEAGKYVALDCEFVGVGPDGKDSALARVSLVNYFGHIILDEFVQPQERVTDWRTWVSGIKPENMSHAIGFSEAQEKVSSILQGKILVGHSVKHDLETLLISHPKSRTRDTARHVPFKQEHSMGKTPSLKKLAKELLGKDIQVGQHSSVEDARITMEIYKLEKVEFERLAHTTHT